MDLISPEQPKLLQILKAPQASRISNGILFYTGQELHELPVCPVPLPLHVDPVDQELIGITGKPVKKRLIKLRVGKLLPSVRADIIVPVPLFAGEIEDQMTAADGTFKLP